MLEGKEFSIGSCFYCKIELNYARVLIGSYKR